MRLRDWWRSIHARTRTNRRRPADLPPLLSGIAIDGVNQVWCSDVTYPDGQGFLPGGRHGLGEPNGAGVAIVNTLGADFCVGTPRKRSLAAAARIFNTDQGSQFTSDDFTGTLKRHGVMISMDSKGRCMDNIFVERLWRSPPNTRKSTSVPMSVAEAKAGVGAWLSFYNDERQHQGLVTARRGVYQEGLWMWTIGFADHGASPLPDKLGRRGNARPHTHRRTTNEGFNIDEVNNRFAEPSRSLRPEPTSKSAGYTPRRGSGCRTNGVHFRLTGRTAGYERTWGYR